MGIEAGVIAAYAAVASAVVGAGAAIMSGQQAKDTAETNAELARRQADQDKDAAVAQAEKIRKAARQQQAEATANLAASGVSIGAGTPLRISNEIYRTSEQDAYQTILSGTRAQRAGDIQAGMLDTTGQNAATAGYLNAGSSLLGGAASAYKAGWAKKTPTTSTGSVQ
ncbi:hypothetical protein [Cupriavidus oxalaticus]|uniref:hypothetical protein n=1 Tax=Cupriavidus oxalaticus TaxID=96344 RepID=UPI0031777DA7